MRFILKGELQSCYDVCSCSIAPLKEKSLATTDHLWCEIIEL